MIYLIVAAVAFLLMMLFTAIEARTIDHKIESVWLRQHWKSELWMDSIPMSIVLAFLWPIALVLLSCYGIYLLRSSWSCHYNKVEDDE